MLLPPAVLASQCPRPLRKLMAAAARPAVVGPAGGRLIRWCLWLIVVTGGNPLPWSLLLPGSTFTAGQLWAAAPKYVAQLSDGSRIEDADVRDWNQPDSRPQLAGRGLLDAGNHARWLLNREQPAGELSAGAVEFHNGDRLPGEFRGYQPAQDTPNDSRPALILFKPAVDWHQPETDRQADLRILADTVRRLSIVDGPARDYRPLTVWWRNGGEQRFESIRFQADHLILLIEGQIREASLNEIAEIHFAAQPGWQTYVDQVAVLSPRLESRLVQIGGTDGLRITASAERMQSRSWGDAGRSENWLQAVQPAWSLDPLWLRFPQLRSWHWWLPDEPPVSVVAPSRVEQSSRFGGGWRWQLDRNTQKLPLVVGNEDYPFGVGMQGGTTLTFPIPLGAIAVRTRFGLDRLAGSGGCVTARLTIDPPPAQPLFEQSFVIGTGAVRDSGWQPLPDNQGAPRSLVLQTDAAHDGRPSGADPWDIRDVADWIEPEFRLDRALLQAWIRRSSLRHLPGLAGWTATHSSAAGGAATGPLTAAALEPLIRSAAQLQSAGGTGFPISPAAFEVLNVFDDRLPRDLRFRTSIKPASACGILARKLRIEPRHRFLAILVSRQNNRTQPSLLQVRINGRVLLEADVPHRENWFTPDPLLVPVKEFHGQTITVELVLLPTKQDSWIDLRGVTLLEQPPGLIALADEGDDLARELQPAAELCAASEVPPALGQHSFRLRNTGPGTGIAAASAIPQLNVAIRDQPQLGEFRYLIWSWKGSEQAAMELGLAVQGQFGDELLDDSAAGLVRFRQRRQVPRSDRGVEIDQKGLRHGFRYLATAATEFDRSSLKLEGKPPREWQLQSRDLVSDFGEFTLSGYRLASLLPGEACFDHVYLARTPQDVEVVKRWLRPEDKASGADPDTLLAAHTPDEGAEVLAQVGPQFGMHNEWTWIDLRREYRGRPTVLRTHPPRQDFPRILQSVANIPATGITSVKLLVANHDNHDTEFLVRVNGQVRWQKVLNDEVTGKDWLPVQVDVSDLAGLTAIIELVHQASGWDYEYLYWSDLKIETE